MARQNKCYTPFVDEVLKYYVAGHSVKETAQRYGVTVNQVNHWVKVRKVSNGRTFRQGGAESNMKRSQGIIPMPSIDRQIEQAKARWKTKTDDLGYDLLAYNGKGKPLELKCRKCQTTFSIYIGSVYRNGISCPQCICLERKQKKYIEEMEKRARKKRREDQAKARELERSKKFEEIHICKVCGKEYTPRQYMDSCGLKLFSNPGYCSKTCKVNLSREKGKEWRKKTKRHSSKHYSRARKLGLPREKGVTLRNLIQRNGLQCQICGMFCDPTANPRSDLYPSMDHIIPLNKGGGHVWSNVQVAHRICNSNKRDYIGKEWHNDAC